MLLIALLAVAVPSASPQITLGAGGSSVQDDEQLVVQQQQQQQQPHTQLQNNQNGRIARSSTGQVGERQTRDTAATQAGIKPMARITNRIQNRVQNRLRTRIDRDYDPQANATDPFTIAEDQTRTTGSIP